MKGKTKQINGYDKLSFDEKICFMKKIWFMMGFLNLSFVIIVKFNQVTILQ